MDISLRTAVGTRASSPPGNYPFCGKCGRGFEVVCAAAAGCASPVYKATPKARRRCQCAVRETELVLSNRSTASSLIVSLHRVSVRQDSMLKVEPAPRTATVASHLGLGRRNKQSDQHREVPAPFPRTSHQPQTPIKLAPPGSFLLRSNLSSMRVFPLAH